MLIMSFTVILFAFFDYFSQPAYWHPQRLFSIPVGIESILFGFAFGGVAAVIYPAQTTSQKQSIDIKKLLALSPVLLISVGLWWVSRINIMITLPLGLLAGCLLIITMRPGLTKIVLYSGLYFGLLYPVILYLWFLLFPTTQQWWNLKIYDNITVFTIPLGEVLFGFVFGGFWGAAYEFVHNYKLKTPAIDEQQSNHGPDPFGLDSFQKLSG